MYHGVLPILTLGGQHQLNLPEEGEFVLCSRNERPAFPDGKGSLDEKT